MYFGGYLMNILAILLFFTTIACAMEERSNKYIYIEGNPQKAIGLQGQVRRDKDGLATYTTVEGVIIFQEKVRYRHKTSLKYRGEQFISNRPEGAPHDGYLDYWETKETIKCFKGCSSCIAASFYYLAQKISSIKHKKAE